MLIFNKKAREDRYRRQAEGINPSPSRISGLLALGSRLSRYFDVHFFLLILVLIGINYPFWNDRIWPVHDTAGVFHRFYFFYNDFFLHGELPRWVPYGSYGFHSNEFQMILTPASYLAIFAGGLMKITGVLVMFKLSVFLEQLILLFGLYRLSSSLFTRKSAVWFVCLGGIASTVWLAQIFFNFRIYYLFPLAFYFLHQFFSQRRPHYLWLYGVTFIVTMMGNVPYFAPLYFVIGTLFFAIHFLRRPWIVIRLFEPSLKNLFFLFLFIAAGALCLYFMSIIRDGAITYASGRDPVTGATVLEGAQGFLNYGGNIGPSKFWGLLHPSKPFPTQRALADITLYVGLLPFYFSFMA